jgi:outer membrane lipoprotein-sorting protein
MKKVLICLTLIMCFLSACKGNDDDIYKSIEMMKDISQNYEFNDYKIIGNSNNQETLINYTIIKANENYYININDDHYYLVNNNEKYHVYSKENGMLLHYKSEDSIEILLSLYTSRLSINLNLNDMHSNLSNHFSSLLNNGSKVSVEKKLFNKISIEFVQENDICKRVSSYKLDNGKITSIFSEYKEKNISLITNLSFEYGSQKLPSYNKLDYKIVN